MLTNLQKGMYAEWQNAFIYFIFVCINIQHTIFEVLSVRWLPSGFTCVLELLDTFVEFRILFTRLHIGRPILQPNDKFENLLQ